MSALVSCVELSLRYGRNRVLQGVDLELQDGDELALVGRSGSGKSTLLLALAGLLPVSGSLAWPGLPQDEPGRRAAIGMVFQAPSLVSELTAAENVALPLRLRGHERKVSAAAAAAALRDVRLADAFDALPAELSGGQQQRVAVARVLAGQPRLLLADEPTGALDSATGALIVQLLRDRVRRVGGALVVATHDDDLAAMLPHQLQMRDGSVLPLAGVA